MHLWKTSFGSREQYAATQPGNLIHADVCGPMSEVSKGGMRYFLCFKDDFTKYRLVKDRLLGCMGQVLQRGLLQGKQPGVGRWGTGNKVSSDASKNEDQGDR